jgi:hypothetical protein
MAMVAELRIRRAATSAAVILLHLLLLLVLLTALRPSNRERSENLREIVVRMLPQAQPHERKPEKELPVPAPQFLEPELPHAITPVPGSAEATRPAQPEGDMGALGRYLFNCSGAAYDLLSAREKAHCLGNQWENKEAPVMLGTAKPSPFDAVIARRNAPVTKATQPCPAGRPGPDRGVDCFSFPQKFANPADQYAH